MDNLGIALGTALWLGILTSISPCPLASNIAALSFLSKKIAHPSNVFWAGIAYTLGRMVSYAALGMLLLASVLSVPQAANFLQKYMNQAFGPLLIVTGLILFGLIRFNLPGFSISDEHQKKLLDSGFAGAFVLGLLFALAFCPFSAALYFGSLIPLSLNHRQGLIFPLFYGAGTGLPVLVFAVLIAFGVKSLNRWFQGLNRIERYMRTVTGMIFILIGLYYSSVYLFKLR